MDGYVVDEFRSAALIPKQWLEALTLIFPFSRLWSGTWTESTDNEAEQLGRPGARWHDPESG